MAWVIKWWVELNKSPKSILEVEREDEKQYTYRILVVESRRSLRKNNLIQRMVNMCIGKKIGKSASQKQRAM